MAVKFRPEIARLWETATAAPFFATELVVYTTGMLRRSYLEIMLITEGTGRLQILEESDEATSRIVRPGTMLLFQPSDSARFVVRGEGGLVTRYVSFSGLDWASFAAMVGFDSVRATASRLRTIATDPTDPTVLAPFELAIERFRSGPTRLDLVRFLTDTVPLLFPGSRAVDASQRGAPDWLVTSLEAMRSEENLRVGVPRLLELAHVSSSYLSVNVRRYFDTTPTNFVLGLRLRHAGILLATTPQPITDISVRCGFGSVSYFSNAFKNRYHSSPRDYRVRSHGGDVSRSG
jgi:AraC-like DNA-binding protein